MATAKLQSNGCYTKPWLKVSTSLPSVDCVGSNIHREGLTWLLQLGCFDMGHKFCFSYMIGAINTTLITKYTALQVLACYKWIEEAQFEEGAYFKHINILLNSHVQSLFFAATLGDGL